MERLCDGAAQGQECSSLYRRWHVARASHRRPSPFEGYRAGQEPGLAIDDMPHMALVATAGSDSIIPDSADSASAYASGHKSAVNAMGVYADRTANPFDDPKVEPIAKLVKRRLNMAVGIVTNTEIEDATPAAMATHTRRRASYDQI